MKRGEKTLEKIAHRKNRGVSLKRLFIIIIIIIQQVSSFSCKLLYLLYYSYIISN